MFVPSRFIRPPTEFRNLYGPNIRQTMLESYFVSKKREGICNVKYDISALKKARQSKIGEYFHSNL